MYYQKHYHVTDSNTLNFKKKKTISEQTDWDDLKLEGFLKYTRQKKSLKINVLNTEDCVFLKKDTFDC